MSVIELVRMLDKVEPSLRSILLGILEEMERQQRDRVTKNEFNELKEVVRELAEAQKKTEERLCRLEDTVRELAEAQKKTEERLCRLEDTVRELAEAQKRTEQRVGELAEAQKRTEQELGNLAKQVGGLSDAVGYGIEDRLMPYIPAYAKRVFGLEILRVSRKNIEYGADRYDEVNILAEGKDANGNPVYLVGECKAQPGKKDADRFAAMLERLSAVLGKNIQAMLIGYTFTPQVEKYMAGRYPTIKPVKTYEIEMGAIGKGFAG
ncbi:MAG: coiled-coil domain-containing protein [Dissulfurimicrobium sp.]|uniref:coiled-coil domain-containing protein n=1 Tax=Dissulfurimicrobium TaxID=1769732 RepID=UPI001EDBE2DD|nr:hypothetical protein [Dissulfurimicrobium hydrothermale]UKL13840.1 hypothetical protein LGS26_00785 [Dissulfurimicrobium hydrothermale]